MMEVPESHIDRLRRELKMIENRCIALLRSGRVEMHVKKQNPWLAFGSGKPKSPEISFRWTQLDPKAALEQSRLVNKFQDLSEEMLGLVSGYSPELQAPMRKAVRKVSNWIQHRSSGGVPGSVETAIDRFVQDSAQLDSILARIQSEHPSRTILVIDTSALLDCPNVTILAKDIDIPKSELIITSTVMKELDELKSSRRDKEFIQKVRRAIRSLQELQKTGNLQEGIEISDNSRIRVVPREPDFSSLPSWIDQSVNDDRIVASAIEIQRSDPSSTTVIITNDLNMQLKADMGHLSTIHGTECHVKHSKT
jgi:rRNA-processing protein FCF1